jgi:hypothetical protein
LILIVEPEKKFKFVLIEGKYVGPPEEGIRTSNSDEKTLLECPTTKPLICESWKIILKLGN